MECRLLNWVEAGEEAHNEGPVRAKGYEASATCVASQGPLGNHPAQAQPEALATLWQLIRTAGVGAHRQAPHTKSVSLRFPSADCCRCCRRSSKVPSRGDTGSARKGSVSAGFLNHSLAKHYRFDLVAAPHLYLLNLMQSINFHIILMYCFLDIF